MTTPASPVLDQVFAALCRYAAAGDRCPQSQALLPGTAIWLQSAHTSALARAGKIRIEIFRLNWRVITILKGEHKGKSTAPDPSGGFPYLTVNANGTFRNGRRIDSERKAEDRRQGPSAPRKIGAEP